MDQVKEVPFHRLLPKWDSQGEISTDDALVCETRQITRICACSGLVVHNINDYPLIHMSKWLSAIIDEVNDGSINTKD